MMAKVVKSVSLNDKAEDDQKILKYMRRKNFSGHVKKLILKEIAYKEYEKEFFSQQ